MADPWRSYIAHLDPAMFRQPMELKAVTAGGILIPIELTVTPLMMEEGTQLFVGYMHDLRERKAREELVRKGQEWERENDYIHATTRLKSEFVANMSHELRTPLNAILGFAQLLFDGRVGELTDQQREYLGDIIAGGRNLLLVIDDVLDWSKVEAGKLEFRAEAVDVEAILLEVSASLQALAGAKRISIEIEIDAALSSVVTDRPALKQVLFKYLSNAIKFTDSGGRTIIRALSETDRMFRVEVEDTGIGIAQENLGKLFIEFQQLDTSESKKYPGTGLGLALTKRLVEAQGGRVGVSTVLGQGSTFFAVLPNAANSSK